MRTWLLVAVVVPAAFLIHCSTVNPLYCSSSVPCSGANMMCDTMKNACVPATTDVDGGPLPDLALPPACKSSMECPVANPVCSGTKCAPCSAPTTDGGTSSECQMFHSATPYCAPSGCVECLTKDDCAAKLRTCNAAKACDLCKANADCSTGVCLDDGTCASKDKIAFVDNRGLDIMPCKNANPAADGKSWATAFCDVKDALANPPQFVVVRGSKTLYSGLDFTQASGMSTVTIIGPGKSATSLAQIGGDKVPGININISGTANFTLVLDGLDIAAGGVMTPDAVKCTVNAGMASLAIRDSNVHDGNYGLNINQCKLVLDRSKVSGHKQGGLKLATSPYTITNNFIVQNLSPSSQAVSLDSDSAGVFAFNTVAGNGTLNVVIAGGLACGGGVPKVIESSIISNNSQSMGTQFFGACQLVNVVTGMDSAMNAIVAAPEFFNTTDVNKPFDYHLKKPSSMNAACCVDKVNPTDGGVLTLPKVDVDSTSRPLGHGWDIGAHEVQ